jgi:hypothetical protein
MGKLIRRALAGCGIVKVPVRAANDLKDLPDLHCGLLVEFNDGRIEGRIYNDDRSAHNFMNGIDMLLPDAEIKSIKELVKIPTEWYKMI